mgnify:CR=1 FL=1
MSVDLLWVYKNSLRYYKINLLLIGVELVGPKRRVLTGTLSSSCYAVGEVFAAGAAWLVQSWK